MQHQDGFVFCVFFIMFIADSMGENESLEGRQNLCQVIKSSVCPKQDRSTGAEQVSLRNNAFLIPFFCVLVDSHCCCLDFSI